MEGTHLPGMVGPWELAGERGFHLKAASPPCLSATCGDPALSGTHLPGGCSPARLCGLEMATLWMVCSKRWVMWPQGG